MRASYLKKLFHMVFKANKYWWLVLFETLVIVGLLVALSWEFAISEPIDLQPATSTPPIVEEPKLITLLFGGDVMFARDIASTIANQQDPLYPFLRIATTTQAADLMFVNLENPVSTRGSNQGSEYSFRAEPTSTINALTYAGVDVVNLANNHIFDYGRTAANDTMQYLRDAGIDYIGFGQNYSEANEPVIKTVGQTKIAFLGYTQFYASSAWATSTKSGLSSYRSDAIIQKIADIKKSEQADLVVVSLHWGDEYKTKANATQKALAHKLVNAGADLIIGNHPHVVQEVEEYNGATIAYSLGNFVFDQNFSAETKSGLLLKVALSQGKVQSVEPIKILFTKTFQPYIP
jgi:poly-gamma-glutamate capsule biosynthesis protein CapA/YwtB (metallophosphatase superfamily)